jgi:hypothetical protein
MESGLALKSFGLRRRCHGKPRVFRFIADLQAFWTLQERLPTQYLTGTFETDVIIVAKESEDWARRWKLCSNHKLEGTNPLSLGEVADDVRGAPTREGRPGFPRYGSDRRDVQAHRVKALGGTT